MGSARHYNHHLISMHIGQLIKEKLREDGHSVTWFATKICCTRSHVYKIFEKRSIDTSLLERICKTLNHNFFEDIANDVSGKRE